MLAGKKLTSNSYYLFLDWTVLSAFSLLFWILTWNKLDPAGTGIVSAASNLGLYLTPIMSFALPLALMKLIPELTKSKKIRGITHIINFSISFISISLIILLAIFIFFTPEISAILNFPKEVIWLIYVFILIHCFNGIVGAIIFGHQKMKQYFRANLFYSIGKIIFTSVLLYIGFSFFGPLIGLISASFVAFLYRVKITKLKVKLNIRQGFAYISENKIIPKFAIPGLVAFLSSNITILGPLILLALVGPYQAGLFSLAFTITAQIAVIPYVFNSALFPLISALSVDKKSKPSQSYLLSLVLRYSLFVILPIALALVAFSKYIIPLVSRGVEYLPASELFPILSISAIILGIGNLFISTLYAIGKTKFYTVIYIVYALIFAISAYFLSTITPFYGVAISYLLAVAFLSVSSYMALKKDIVIIFPIKTLAKIALATIIALVFLYLSKFFVKDIILAVIVGGISICLYAISLLFMKFYSHEDVAIIKFLANKSPTHVKKQIFKVANLLSKFV